MIAKWLRERLGEPTRGRGARAAKCLVCHADVLAGPDEDVMAMPAICDPHPLNPLGEALALIEGRSSYRLSPHKGGMAFYARAHWDISGSPASEKVLVFTDHKCHTPQFPGIEIKKSSVVENDRVPYDATPPF